MSRSVATGHRLWPWVAAMILLSLQGCGTKNTAAVTSDFTHRMAAVERTRTSVENRVTTLKQDCTQGLIPAGAPYCDNGATWYTDNVMGLFNAWITEVEADLTDTRSLQNLTSYDPDLNLATRNAEAFDEWVDKVHAAFTQAGQSTGALGGPSLEDVAKVGIELGVAVWKQYQAGKDAHVDELKSAIDQERFQSFAAI